MHWDNLFEMTPRLIGGSIEILENDTVYKGPLTNIRREGETVYFCSLWLARFNPVTNTWENDPDITTVVDMSTTNPKNIGDDRVRIIVPLVAEYTLFPPHWPRLHPRHVRGLNLRPKSTA
jgi:hypothetical protein